MVAVFDQRLMQPLVVFAAFMMLAASGVRAVINLDRAEKIFADHRVNPTLADPAQIQLVCALLKQYVRHSAGAAVCRALGV
jgi:hypothetical protein